MSTPLPLTHDLIHAIDWWKDNRRNQLIHGRHADRCKRGDLLLTFDQGTGKLTSTGGAMDEFDRAVIESVKESSHLDIIDRAHYSGKVREQLTAMMERNTKSASWNLRAWCATVVDAKEHEPLTDRVAATSLTVARARCILTSVLANRPVFDFSHSKSKASPVTSRKKIRQSGAPSKLTVPKLNVPVPEVASTRPEPSEVPTVPGSPDSATARRLLGAVGIDLDALVTEMAPPPVIAAATGESHTPTSAFDVPAKNPHFTVPKDCAWHDAFEALDLAHAVNARKNLLVTGPTGCGKTEGATHYAATRKRPAITIDCTQLVEPTDAFGAMIAEDGSTKFIPSAMCKALATTDAVVILDEVNRASVKVLNSLFSILDGRGTAHIDCVLDEDGKPIEVTLASNVVIVMTANIGASYRGTGRIDAAFKNRAHATVRVDYLTRPQESKLLQSVHGLPADDAKVIADLACWTRMESERMSGGKVNTAASTRNALNAAQMAAHGLPIFKACRLAIVDGFDDTLEREAATIKLQELCK